MIVKYSAPSLGSRGRPGVDGGITMEMRAASQPRIGDQKQNSCRRGISLALELGDQSCVRIRLTSRLPLLPHRAGLPLHLAYACGRPQPAPTVESILRKPDAVIGAPRSRS
jgi:hypothetical protein